MIKTVQNKQCGKVNEQIFYRGAQEQCKDVFTRKCFTLYEKECSTTYKKPWSNSYSKQFHSLIQWVCVTGNY